VAKVARLLLEAKTDVLAFYAFPAAHRSKRRNTIRWSGSTARAVGRERADRAERRVAGQPSLPG